MKKLLTLVILMTILVACSPSPEAIEKALEKTQAAMPTATVIPTATTIPTPTQIPLEDIDLTGLVFQTGDLPPGYDPSQIRSELGNLTENAPKPDNYFSQSLSYKGENGGLVDLLIYEDLEKVQDAYTKIVSEMPGDEYYVPVGEIGQAATNLIFTYTTTLTFTRCHAVASIQFIGTFDSDSVISYAKRLDERLQPLVCRSSD